METKTCTKCGPVKGPQPLTEFYKNPRAKDGLMHWCKSCIKENYLTNREVRAPAKKTYDATHKHVHRKANLKANYRLTPEEFDLLVTVQQGLCAICRCSGAKLVVDHNHSTGKVRGLLCPNCNHGLGRFMDSSELLLRAAEYVVKELQ